MCGLLSNKLVIYGQYGAYGVCWTSITGSSGATADCTPKLFVLLLPSSTGAQLQPEWSGQRSKHIPKSSQCSSAMLQLISKKVVLAGGCRSPSSSLSTSLPPSPSSWQKEDWEPDFLEAALISLEVKVGVVHNCTIFLWSLDVRNIVQGGGPLYAAVNHKQGCGGCIWPKWVRFFEKNTCL